MTTQSVAEARATFSKIVECASSAHERFGVTRNGLRAATLLRADDFDALLKTVEIRGNSALLASIRGADIHHGALPENLHQIGVRLKKPLFPLCSADRGDYRVIY